MKLLHLEVKNFGKLHNFRMDLHEGLNILCEQNGFGKSTLAVFIKAMLYGLPATTKRNLDENERRKYLPWQGGEYGGWIEFESSKGAFRAERFFGSKEAGDRFSLTDIYTGKASTAYSANLGLELFGIDAEGFERSTYLSQRILDGEWKNDSVTAKLSGLLENVDDIGNFDSAMKLLDDGRKVYELKGGKGKIADLDSRLREVNTNIEGATAKLSIRQDLEAEVNRLRGEFHRNSDRLEHIRQTVSDEKVRATHREEWERRQKILQEKKTRQEEIRDGFGGVIPTEEELNRAEEQLQEYLHARDDYDKAVFPPEDQSRLDQLNENYPQGLPAVEELARIRRENEALHDTKIQRDSFCEEPTEALADRFHGMEPPTHEMIGEAQDLLYRADATKRQLDARTAQNHKHIAVSAFLYPLLAGIVLLLAGAFVGESAAVKLPFFIIGGVFATVGCVILAIFAFSRRNRADGNEEVRLLQKDYEERIEKIRSFLNTYESLPQNGDYHSALSLLETLADHARENRSIRSKRNERIQDFNQKIADSESKISAFLAEYGVTTIPQEYARVLDRMDAEKREWASLMQKRERHLRYREQYQQQVADCIKMLSSFLNRYQPLLDENPQLCLKKIQALCEEHARLFRETRTEDLSLQEYAQVNKLHEESISTTANALLDEESLLKQRQIVLQTELEDRNRQLNIVVKETDALPDWNDEKAELIAQREKAKDDLFIIQNTADFLMQAKDSLSTRYLPGMRKSLSEYLSLLGNHQIASATIDASFEVAVEEVGVTRDFKAFSQGWRDILQFCARLSLVDTLFSEGETPFLLLDDPFVNLDNDRLADAKKLLEALSERYQTLHFVCHTDRK